MHASHFRGDCLSHSAAQSSCTFTHSTSTVLGIPIPLMIEEDVLGSELPELPPISAKLIKLADPCSHGCPCESSPKKVDKQEMPTNLGCCVPGCALEVQYLPRVHAFRHHIPGIFDDRLPCTDASIVKGREMALAQVATWLLCRPFILSEQVDLVNRQRVLAPLSGVRMSSCRLLAGDGGHMQLFAGFGPSTICPVPCQLPCRVNLLARP
ncbi:hypothetical protein DPMN_174497 [Dreissena polymorpha]|uniref:Uncharacterized protein n=1 Tax=Dreissena polymorpha TaxID=45954 RepID=A0A9D4E3H9_DREPO|nr:hypothetical protein DPMN_174497 [Dreissena polymorpha]